MWSRFFLLGQQYRSGGPSRYSEHVFKVHRKCFRGIWKKFLLKTWGRNKSQIRGWNLLKKPRVLSWKSFSNASKTLFVDFQNMLGVSERSTWPRSLPQYKKRDHTTHQSDYILGKVKKVEILKNEAQNEVRIFSKIVTFWAETLFQRPLENFS